MSVTKTPIAPASQGRKRVKINYCVPLCTADIDTQCLFIKAFYTPWQPIGPGLETLRYDQTVLSFCYIKFSAENIISETSFRDKEQLFLKIIRTFEEMTTYVQFFTM